MRHFVLTLCLCGLVAMAPAHAQTKIIAIQTAKQLQFYPAAVVMPHNSQWNDTREWLLGAWENGQWVAGKRVAQQLRPFSWNVQDLQGNSEQVTSQYPPQHNQEGCGETVFVHMPTKQRSKQYRLATSPKIKAQPRPIQTIPNTHRAYHNILRQELFKLGIESPRMNITNIIRADLDGNGTQEVILAASYYKKYSDGSLSGQTRTDRPPARANAGDYSVVLLRSIQNGKINTTMIHKDLFIQEAKDEGTWLMPTLSNLAGIADLNGDGRMELVLWETYYEGTGVRVLEWTPKTGLKQRLSVGCGV